MELTEEQFVILVAQCTADRLRVVLAEDLAMPHYASTVQPGAHASVAVHRDHLAAVRAELKAQDIESFLA